LDGADLTEILNKLEQESRMLLAFIRKLKSSEQ